MIVCTDLAGAELRVVSILAGDQPFLTKFRSGQSPHFDTAKALFGRDIVKGTEEYRIAKAFIFRYIYTVPGAGINDEGGKLALHKVGLSAAALPMMIARVDRDHPALVAWKHKMINGLLATCKVYDPFGAYRNMGWAVKSWDKSLQLHAKNACLNFPIQSSIRWITNRAFVRIDKAIERWGWPTGEGLVLNEHDSLSIYCAPERVADASKILKEGLEQPVPELGGERMVAEVKVGETWGSVKPVEVE